MFFHPHLLLSHDEQRKTEDGRKLLEKHLSEFEACLDKRKLKMEFSILSRMSGFKEKYD